MRRVAATLGLGTILLVPSAASAFGPNADPDSPAVTNCAGPGENYESGVVARQTDRQVQAGGGPKSGAVAPANCDHYWQGEEEVGGAEAIGNGWPPPSKK